MAYGKGYHTRTCSIDPHMNMGRVTGLNTARRNCVGPVSTNLSGQRESNHN